jgi:hypothetical protein
MMGHTHIKFRDGCGVCRELRIFDSMVNGDSFNKVVVGNKFVDDYNNCVIALIILRRRVAKDVSKDVEDAYERGIAFGVSSVMARDRLGMGFAW